MKAKKTILVAAMQVVSLFVLSAQSLAAIHTVTYSDGLSCGELTCPSVATTTQAATLTTAPCLCRTGGTCFKALISKAYAFSFASAILLPKVGETYDGGLFDQTFHDTTKTHEDWHYKYIDALLGVTYGALEAWSASYASNCMHTEAEALALGNTDLTKALTAAESAFTKDFYTQVTFETKADSYCHVVTVGGVDTWRSVNPDWGQAAVNYANAITVSFKKGAGTCECIPEPSTFFIFTVLVGMGLLGRRTRRRSRS